MLLLEEESVRLKKYLLYELANYQLDDGLELGSLAEYIMAMLKNDFNLVEMKENCIRDLKEFLGEKCI